MKYQVFVARKPNCLPIQECGGIVLGPKDKLLVDELTGKKLARAYAGIIIEATTEEKEKLASGHYEYVPCALRPKAENQSPIVMAVAEDKSMVGKSKRKVK